MKTFIIKRDLQVILIFILKQKQKMKQWHFIIEENEDIIDIHDFLCECKHKRLTMSPNEHIGTFSLEQMEEFNNDPS